MVAAPLTVDETHVAVAVAPVSTVRSALSSHGRSYVSETWLFCKRL